MPADYLIADCVARIGTTNQTYEDYYVFDYLDQEDNFETRLGDYWDYLASYILTLVLCALVMAITVFDKKYITGDYKWFILNQIIASFINSFGNLLQYAIVFVYFGQNQWYQMQCPNPPVWQNVYGEISVELGKFGMARYPALFATVFNRWAVLALSNYNYSFIMSPRLIFFYCFLCYLLMLPIDDRVTQVLHIPLNVVTYFIQLPILIPWLLSIIFSISVFYMLWQRMRAVTSILDKHRLKENRAILFAVIIQIVIPLFDKIPQFVIQLLLSFKIISPEVVITNWFFRLLIKIGGFNLYFSDMYTCLITLITLRPYRRAMLSLLSPVTKRFKCCAKLDQSNSDVIPISSTKSPRIVRIPAGVS